MLGIATYVHALNLLYDTIAYILLARAFCYRQPYLAGRSVLQFTATYIIMCPPAKCCCCELEEGVKAWSYVLGILAGLTMVLSCIAIFFVDALCSGNLDGTKVACTESGCSGHLKVEWTETCRHEESIQARLPCILICTWI